jgi:hypothetical protein
MSVPPAFQLSANYAMLTLHLKTSCLFAKSVLGGTLMVVEARTFDSTRSDGLDLRPRPRAQIVATAQRDPDRRTDETTT